MDDRQSLDEAGLAPAEEPRAPAARRQNTPKIIAHKLRERILSGEFAEGEQIRQEAVAEEYQVSRMPVREALQQLEAAGLVELHAHRGAVVVALPLEQIGELFDLRALVECDALKRAIPRMTPADLERARALLGELEEAYVGGDVQAWGALNWAFHRSLYAPSGRARTMALLEGVNAQVDRYVRLQLVLSEAIGTAELEHRRILRLCEEGETRAATALLKRHILSARDVLVAHVAEHRAREAAARARRSRRGKEEAP